MIAPAIDRALRVHAERPDARDAAHLADYSFRFDRVAAERAALPDRGRDWTLAQTLAELRRRAATVTPTSRGLRLAHAHRMPELAEAVGRHHRAVRAWLDLGGRAAPALGWDDETDFLARWFDARPAPDGPVALRPGVAVTDWPRFGASVADRFAAGPSAPCADGLRRDLRDLFAADEPVRLRPVQTVRRSRAA